MDSPRQHVVATHYSPGPARQHWSWPASCASQHTPAPALPPSLTVRGPSLPLVLPRASSNHPSLTPSVQWTQQPHGTSQDAA